MSYSNNVTITGPPQLAKEFTCFQCATKISFVSEEIPELSKIAKANDLCWITYERQVETGEKSNNRSKGHF